MARDPNKYSKNADIKPESKLSVLLAILRLVLMLIGIFGVAFELFREDGWLSKLLGDIFNSTTNMLLAALVLSGLWLLNRWISNPQKTQSRGIGDIPMYAMMAVGAYYLYHLYSSGRLMF
jgi:hypothetical protein